MTSAWISQYQQASFRGVPFFISRASNSTGRRIESHAFPDREDIYHQDLGRAERTFSLSAYIIADDYFQARENLILACEAPGTGKLIHPYRGEFTVVCKSCDTTESTGEGRMVRFNLEFAEQVESKLTATATNTSTAVLAAQAETVTAQKDAFDEAYDIVSKPAKMVQDVIDTLNKGLDTLDKVKRVTSAVSEFQQAVLTARGKVQNYALDFEILANDINLLISFGTDPLGIIFPANSANAGDQYREMRDLFSRKSAESSDTSPVLYDDPEYPAQVVQRFMAYNAAIQSTGLVTVYPLSNIEQAEELRQEIYATFDEISNDPITNDALFAAIRDLRQAVSDNLDERILNLSTVAVFTLPENRTTLNITNEFYGDSEKEQEFQELNDILHPGMLPAAIELKVEIDATK